MKPNQTRDLEILTAIEEGEPLTQRALAARLGVALGLANLYLKKLAAKGLIKIGEFPKKPAPRKRLRYLLTPKGIAAKGRLTYEYMAYSMNLYRRARQNLREALALLPENGMKRLALYGTGDAAELAYLTLKEFSLEPLAVFAREGGASFLGAPVRAVSELAEAQFDGVILGTFEPPEPHIAALVRLGVPRAKCITLRRVLASDGGAGG